jgi:nitrite reductase (cytochrome c-552)
MRNIAIDATLQLAKAIGAAVEADSTATGIAEARQYQRRAQFYTDFVEAENSMGFHADQEAVRILGKAVNFARLGQMALRGEEIPAAVGGSEGAVLRPPETVTPPVE